MDGSIKYYMLLQENIKDTIKASFEQFGLTLDGTPVFAEAECVVIRLVHKETWEIIELVIHLKLYAESLNGESIAHNILESMMKHDLDPAKWRATMLDRASTNKGALRLIEEKVSVSPFSAFCISHGYSGCGKKHKMTVGSRVLKQLTKMVQSSMCRGMCMFCQPCMDVS